MRLLLKLIDIIRKAGSGTKAADFAIECARKRYAKQHLGFNFDKALEDGIQAQLLCGNDGEPIAVTLLGLFYVKFKGDYGRALQSLKDWELSNQGGNVSA